jgi:methyl-accepting chemotaxis protein
MTMTTKPPTPAGLMRDRINQTLEAAIALTETEVLSAGGTLAEILQESQDQLADLDRLTNEFSEQAGASPTLGALADQLINVLADTPRLFKRVADQVAGLATSADRAQGETREIMSRVIAIAAISTRAKLLAINTRIEASRLGNNEKTIAVVANEMRSLSDQVKQASDATEQLARSLGESLPSVAKAGNGLLELCLGQAAAIDSTVSPFRGAYQRARETVTTSLDKTRDRSQRIQLRYDAILRCLQFQDRASQQIRGAEKIAAPMLAALDEIKQAVDAQGSPALQRLVAEIYDRAVARAEHEATSMPAQGPAAGTEGRTDGQDLMFL